MKAARFYDNHDIRIEDIPKPEPRPGEVLVDVAWGGICGTDLHEYLLGPKAICTKEAPHKLTGEYLPVTMGHEYCGHVASTPDHTLDANGTELRVGTPVMVDPRLNCGECFSCKAGETHMCNKWGFTGLHGHGGGGFSESVAVRADMCYALPKDMPLDHAVLIEPLAVGRHALVQSGIPLDHFDGKSVLVIGGGPVGFAVLCNLTAAGTKLRLVSEPAKARQNLVKMYADHVLDPMKQSVSDECRRLTDDSGVDVVFDCAGIPPGMTAGMQSLRPKGIYVNVAGWEADFVLPIQHIMSNEITIRSTLAYDDKDFGDVVKDFIDGKFKGVEAMITARIALDDIVEQGFEQLLKNKDHHSKILVTPRSDLLPRKRRNTGAASQP